MTAIDFAAFVDELATVSGETIRPFFRSALGVEMRPGPDHRLALGDGLQARARAGPSRHGGQT